MFLNISVFVIIVFRQLIHPVCLLFSAFFYWNKDYNLLDQLYFSHTYLTVEFESLWNLIFLHFYCTPLLKWCAWYYSEITEIDPVVCDSDCCTVNGIWFLLSVTAFCFGNIDVYINVIFTWDFYYWDQADHFVTSVPF